MKNVTTVRVVICSRKVDVIGNITTVRIVERVKT